MSFTDSEKSYYEILEIAPTADSDEIRAAYQRAKSAYKKDSVALYSLMSEDESIELLRQIETAYRVLSDDGRRVEYDRKIGKAPAAAGRVASPFDVTEDDGAKVISIDRVPPMEDVSDDENILVAPSTDFTANAARAAREERRESRFDPSPNETSSRYNPTLQGGGAQAQGQAPTPLRASEPVRVAAFREASPTGERRSGILGIQHPTDSFNEQPLKEEIARETEWRGAFLRKVREARGTPLEELSEYTKIGKTYLIAIEEENYAKLPAPVYLRGFLIQIGKYMKLPPDALSQAYLARLNAWLNSDKNKLRA